MTVPQLVILARLASGAGVRGLLLEAVLVLIEARLRYVAVGPSDGGLAARGLLGSVALARDMPRVVHADFSRIAIVVVLNIDVVVYVVHVLLL